MNEVFSFLSESGDEYRLSLTTSVGGELIAEDISESLLRDGIELVDVGLSRVKGSHITTFSILQQIEQCIANVFMQHPNAIICFFCDFISLIPSMKRESMSVQEYRSRLFSKMFEQYLTHHHIEGIRNRVVEIEGVVETYYVHVIARNSHQKYVDMISMGIQRDYGKPID